MALRAPKQERETARAKTSPPMRPKTLVPNAYVILEMLSRGEEGRGGGEGTNDCDGVGLADCGGRENEVVGDVCEQVRCDDDGHCAVDDAGEVALCVLHLTSDKVDL